MEPPVRYAVSPDESDVQVRYTNTDHAAAEYTRAASAMDGVEVSR
jgi:hypothetical protein